MTFEKMSFHVNREKAKQVLTQIDKAIKQERQQLEAEKIKAEQPTKSVNFEDCYREEAGQGKNRKEESPPLTVVERYKQAMERHQLVRDPDRPSKSYQRPADRYKEAMERKKPSMHDIIEETKRKFEEEKRHHEPEQHHKDKYNRKER